MDVIPVSCAIILNDVGQILVVQRSAQMKLPLKWEFPGGKIEAGETPEDCLIREIKEELKITIEILNRRLAHVHDYPNFRIELIPYTAKIIAGEIDLLEHAQYQWLDKSVLSALEWAEADIPIVQDFLNA